jgi:hypothetical protein
MVVPFMAVSIMIIIVIEREVEITRKREGKLERMKKTDREKAVIEREKGRK